MTGGDPITARYMRGDFFTYQPQFKPVIAGNHRPGFRNPDEAIRRRLHLVPFDQTFAAPDRDLEGRLRAEAGGILQWAIDGCLQWQQHGLSAPESVRLATSEYLETQDVVGAWLDACTESAPDAWTKGADLFASWQEWAKNRGEKAGNQGQLTDRITSRPGYTRGKSRGERGIFGLRLRLIAGMTTNNDRSGHAGQVSPISTSHARAHTQAVRLNGDSASTVSKSVGGQLRITWRNGETSIISRDDPDLQDNQDLIDHIEELDQAA